MAEKVTTMKLKVDLECEKCYKKVKKLLSKYPQIRDQKFDKKENIVTITVVCCSPEKIRDKLCCKGGGSIKSIEIVEPPKPKPPDKPVQTSKPESDKKKDDEKPKPESEKKKDAEKPKPDAEKKKDAEKPKSEAPKKETEKPKPESGKPKDNPAPPPIPVQPPPMAIPVGMCVPSYDGRPVGPCYNYGGPVLCYDGYYARPIYDSYGGGRPYYVSRCDQYFSDENTSGCTIM